jgi:hypothetical protein
LVAFLGYALWVTLKHLLQRRPAIVPEPSASAVDNAQPLSPMKTLALLSTLQSADIVLRPPSVSKTILRKCAILTSHMMVRGLAYLLVQPRRPRKRRDRPPHMGRHGLCRPGRRLSTSMSAPVKAFRWGCPLFGVPTSDPEDPTPGSYQSLRGASREWVDDFIIGSFCVLTFQCRDCHRNNAHRSRITAGACV